MNLKTTIEEMALLEASIRQDDLSSEFMTYTALWVKTRMPEVYNELESNFAELRPNIYAAQQSDVNNSGF